MLYSEEVLDRRTGELITINRGEWITVTELAGLYGVGPRKARSVLRKMEFLGIEGSRDHARHRLQPWAVECGYGRRLKTMSGSNVPFDVISPEGREWIAARWSSALGAVDEAASGARLDAARTALSAFQESRGRQAMPVHEAVCWLLDHDRDGSLSHTDIAAILDVTQQLVSRYVAKRDHERRIREAQRNAVVVDLGRIKQRALAADQGDDVNGWDRYITEVHNTR